MSSRWLIPAILLLSACYRTNPSNCRVTPSACSATEVCDSVTERCIDPGAIDCATTSCPTGSSCNQQTNRCEATLSITSTDTPYIKSTGSEIILINGSGFQSGAEVSFNGNPAINVEFISSSQLRVTTPSRQPGTKKCGKLPLTVRNPDNSTKTAPAFFAYYFEPSMLVSQSLPPTLGTDPSQLTVVDLNRDGQNDLVAVTPGQPPRIFLGTGAGLPTMAVQPNAMSVNAVAIDPEPSRSFLITADSINGMNNLVYRIPNTGVLNLTRVNTIVAAATVTSFLAEDLDADGYRDVIGLQNDGQIFGVIRNPDWETMSTIPLFFPTGLTATSITAGKYYGDIVRVAAISTSSSEVNIIRYDRAARVFRSDDSLTLSEKAAQLVDGDVNGDGKRDLIVFMASGTARIFLNSDGFASTNTQDALFGQQHSSVAVGDVDCDGRADLVGVGGIASSAEVTLWLARTGGFAPLPTTGKLEGRAVTIGDVNDDGIPDVVVYQVQNQPMVRIGVPKS